WRSRRSWPGSPPSTTRSPTSGSSCPCCWPRWPGRRATRCCWWGWRCSRRSASGSWRGPGAPDPYARTVLELRPTPFDHPDAQRLIAELQDVYRERYGGEDDTPVDPREFAPPGGHFVVGYAGG